MIQQKSKSQFAKTLRKNQTEAEKKLWFYLRDRRFLGLKFRRQHIVDPYIADFCCIDMRLIIELDGSQHFLNDKQDNKRTQYLNQKGYRVLRFWDHDVLKDENAVLNAIKNYLNDPHPGPLPKREREKVVSQF